MAGRYGTSNTAQLPLGYNGHALTRRAKPQPWKQHAACTGLDPDLFYPPPGAIGRAQADAARTVCAGCPVRLNCLAYALANGEELGIWGGTTERDRRRIRGLLVRLRSPDRAA